MLRRIMRRAMRHAHMLGCKDPLIWRLVPALVQQMGAGLSGTAARPGLISETLRLEEGNFKQMLERGLRLLEDETARLRPDDALPGEIAFRLYDTYGFPLDLTEDVLRGQGRAVAVEGFETAMARQREEARRSWVGSGEAGDRGLVRLARGGRRHRVSRLRDRNRRRASSLAIMRGGERITEAATGDEIAVILNQTPFYAESAGKWVTPGRSSRHRAPRWRCANGEEGRGLTSISAL